MVVPAHNEEDLVERCITSLQQIDYNGPSIIVVVADDCSDGTVRLARSILGKQGVVAETTFRNVGRARGLGSAIALEELRQLHPGGQLWLANTDADSCVSPQWVKQQLLLADAGFHAVAGVVDLDSFADFPPGFEQRFAESYGVGSGGTHDHVQSTNLGVSAVAYEAVGGWPPIKNGEDGELWKRLRLFGFSVASERSIRVLTSGRAFGRIQGGFADSLRLLADRPLEFAS
jgi:glycosyltransferase involved in cell wall biosynthesis